ncbi:MAG: response regulator [Bacteroidales bacterium]|nr:response regulator [Bacteroidales bacterium]
MIGRIFCLRSPFSIGIFILTALPFTTHAQSPSFQFQHLNIEEGLSNSIVHAIYRDKMGFMWFGTEFGLNKYDGYTFTVFQHNSEDTTSIASNYIVRILEDSYGEFWVGHGVNGIDRFDRGKEVFTRYMANPERKGAISNNNIRAIYEDSQKRLWIGTAGGGLNLYNRESESFVHFVDDPQNPDDLGSNYISAIAEDANGVFWLVSPEGWLIRFNPDSGKGKRFYLYENPNNLNKCDYGNVYIDSDNNLWACTEKGLFYYSQQTGTLSSYTKGETNRNLNENAVTGILEISKGIFMITVDHGGINLLDRQKGTFTYHLHNKLNEYSLSNNQPMTIYQAPDKAIWIGSFKGGVNFLDKRAVKFQRYRDLVESSEVLNATNSVLTICEDKDKNIWIGTDGQGIDIIDPETFSIRHLKAKQGDKNTLQGDVVSEIFRDSDNNMWVGMYLEGLTKIDNKTGAFTHYRKEMKNESGICGNNIWTICEDRHGYLWIGSVGNGLDRMDKKTNTFQHYRNNPSDPESLCNDDVFKVFQDKSGQLWVGTRDGLCLKHSNSSKFKRFVSGSNGTSEIRGSWIYDIYEDHYGNLWVGTDLGLNLYIPGDSSFKYFSEPGLDYNKAVYSITGDEKDNLWISSNNGLYQFNLQDKTFRSYDIADGLQSNEFNYTSVLKASDGRIYFGGRMGFNVFHPDSIRSNPDIPPVFLTSVLVMNNPVNPRKYNHILSKNINFAGKIVLDHRHYVVTFGFAALNYINPQRNQYAYRLEGFDTDWNYIGNKHEVTYTNLNPGRYLLRVKGSNNDGVWNEEGVRLQVIVLPPWYKTWWFRAFVFVTLAGLLLLFYYLRIKFYRQQQKKLSAMVQERTQQLEEVAVALEEKQEEVNEYNEELKTQADELNNHRNRLETLVNERTRELIQAKEKAEESDKLKSSFLANMSHEIRTPLNAILGFSAMLGEEGLTADERTEFNKIMQSSSDTLLDLINDILDISKIESGQMQVERNTVALKDIISELKGIFGVLLQRIEIGHNKNIELRFSIPDEILQLTIVTDRRKILQVLSNLLSNALKFTREGYIEIGCCRHLPDDRMLEFYVRDTGIGIKEEHLGLIFERFRKVEENKERLQRGTGLGLAIARQLVQLLCGRIWAESVVNKGSTFYFIIPFIIPEMLPTSPQENTPGTLHFDFDHLQILVAEDDFSNYQYLKKLLKKTGAEIVHARDGMEALQALETNMNIALVLLDIKMPVMDGIETLKEMKLRKIGVPVIAQTAYALADEIVRLKKEGFDDYITKPIRPAELYQKIGRFIIKTGS